MDDAALVAVIANAIEDAVISTDNATAAIIVGLAALAAGVLGYVIGQYQHGKPFRLTDPSTESPSPIAYELLGQPAAGD